MVVVESVPVAVLFCVVTMLCWGSWANTQKAVGQRWRFELFYWDYVFGVVLATLVFAFTMGSMGSGGRGFLADLAQADSGSFLWALAGGVVFNAANILLVAAIAVSGMAVAFPVGIGMALVLGVLINYFGGEQTANPTLLFLGVALVAAAIILDAAAYRRLPRQGPGGGVKGLVLSVLCGILMSMFYFLVQRSLADAQPGGALPAGKMTAYTASFVFALGILLSNFVFNTAIMIKPFVGQPVPLADYFKGQAADHFWGVVGGCIWGVGWVLNLVASHVATPAVSYGLRPRGDARRRPLGRVHLARVPRRPRGVAALLTLMFLGYISGLALVIVSRLA